jgi:hypothetical protein
VWGLGRGFGRFIDATGIGPGEKPTAEQALAVAERVLEEESRPLFLYVHLIDPHMPYRPALDDARALFPDYDPDQGGEVLMRTDSGAVIDAGRRRYDAEIHHVDRALGHFLGTLRQRDLYRRTALVVVGDHGEEFHEHGGVSHGRSVYEEQLHVPLVVKLPDDAHAGRRVPGLVSLVDVMPTIAEVVRWPARPDVDGRSLLGLIEGHQGGRPELTASAGFADELKFFAVIAGHHKLVRQVRPVARTFVFDLEHDPAEREPLPAARVQPALLDALEAQLARRQAGWHLRTCGGEERRVVRLAVAGVGGEENAVHLEPEARLTGGSGSKLHLRSVVGPIPRRPVFAADDGPQVVYGEDELRFSGAAPILAFAPGVPPATRFGRERANIHVAAVRFDAARARTVPSEAPDCLGVFEPTVLVWYVDPGFVPGRAEPDETLRIRLKGLGYAE